MAVILHSALLALHLNGALFMKTRSTRSLRRLLFKIRFFCDYADSINQLEKALARKPERLQLDIIRSGELSPDSARLVDNEKVDHFLASAFSKASVSPESDKPGPQTESRKLVSKIPSSNQAEQNN